MSIGCHLSLFLLFLHFHSSKYLGTRLDSFRALVKLANTMTRMLCFRLYIYSRAA